MEWYQKNEKIKELMKQLQDLIKLYKVLKKNFEDLDLINTEEYRLFINFTLKSIKKVKDLIQLL